MLKLRLSQDVDFIEIDIEKNKLAFSHLNEIIKSEFNVEKVITLYLNYDIQILLKL